MGSRGGNAPNPYTERQVSTRFLRVPILDWPAVKVGRKTEFRRAIARRAPIFAYTPTPVVGYTLRGQTYDHKLMVLEEVRHETLWAVSEDEESLRREGFDTYDEFRSYWKRRTGGYLPLSMVYVYRVSPWYDGADAVLGARLIQHLYGEFDR